MKKIHDFSKMFSEAELKAYYRAVGLRAVGEFKELLIHNIKSNKYGFTLADSTISRKIGLNRNTPFINSGEYVSAIEIQGTKVGVKEGTHSSGLSYKEIRFILEYGRLDKHVPARPVWRMTLKEFRPRYIEIAKEELKKYFSSKLNQ